MRTDISVALELSEETSMQTKVSLHSFIEKNRWFDGTVYLLTLPYLRVTNRTFSEIKMIYSKVEVINITDDSLISKTINSIRAKSTESDSSLIDSLKLGSLLIEGNVLYLSHRSLFLSDVEFFLGKNELRVSQIFNLDSSSIFYLGENLDKADILTRVCNSIIREDIVFSKRKIHNVFCNEVKNTESMNFVNSQKLATSSNYLDRYFTKLKNNIKDLSYLHFEEKIFNNPLYTKINQIWLQKARSVKNLTASPVNLNKRTIIKKTPELEYIKSTVDVNSVEKRFSVSIIIPAFKAADYIEECLNSIVNQTTTATVEILIGIDSCQSTLVKIQQIAHKYPNLKVFYSSSSLGAYVMRNSLTEKASHENFLFFDADDIMLPSLISTILKNYSKPRPIRFKYINFNHGDNPIKRTTPHPKPSHGVFFIPRYLFYKIGGFQNWPCGADTEFMKRCSHNGINDVILNIPLFYRRIHSTSLTQNPKTGYRSDVRSQINLKIKNMISWSIPINRVTSKIEQI